MLSESKTVFYLEDAVLNGEDGHIEGPTAQVVDEDVLLPGHLLVQAVGDSGRRRLVDNAKDVEAGNNAGILNREHLTIFY